MVEDGDALVTPPAAGSGQNLPNSQQFVHMDNALTWC